jgi:hypothetical protein
MDRQTEGSRNYHGTIDFSDAKVGMLMGMWSLLHLRQGNPLTAHFQVESSTESFVQGDRVEFSVHHGASKKIEVFLYTLFI